MKNSYEKIVSTLEELKTFIKNSKYIDEVTSNREGSYSFTQIETYHTTAKNKKNAYAITIMKELIKTPVSSLTSEQLNYLTKEFASLDLKDCLVVASSTALPPREAYNQATDIVTTHIKNIKHFFNVDKMLSRGYSGNRPEIVSESIEAIKIAAQQDCTINLLKLIASNPEILTIQDVSGNNLGMEFARLGLQDCLDIALTNEDACKQKNEAGLTIEAMVELSKPKALRKKEYKELSL